MAISLSITYSDGTREDVTIRPLGLVAAERQFGSGTMDAHSIEAILYAAWFLKGKPTGSLDDWLATVDDAERKDESLRPLDPTPLPEESPT